jgi:hypothetical protein
MSVPSPDLVLTLYGRAGCHLCDELRAELTAALEDREAAGRPVPSVAEIDVDADPALRDRYGALVPVVALRGQELPLVMSGRQLRAFLDRVIGGADA